MAPFRFNISLLSVLLCRILIGVSMSFICTSALTLTILYRRRSAAQSFFTTDGEQFLYGNSVSPYCFPLPSAPIHSFFFFYYLLVYYLMYSGKKHY